VPDASTLSQNRRRRFADSTIYQEIFDEIVIQAIGERANPLKPHRSRCQGRAKKQTPPKWTGFVSNLRPAKAGLFICQPESTG
jgi:hypothetical protein